ncbi:MAG: hypothetical protein JWO42_3009 [Chloroflexi bacterium]|nr:hypothetical protein [Chloroflexota bacterium]
MRFVLEHYGLRSPSGRRPKHARDGGQPAAMLTDQELHARRNVPARGRIWGQATVAAVTWPLEMNYLPVTLCSRRNPTVSSR